MLTNLRSLYGKECDLVSHSSDRRINLEPDHKRELIAATERDGLLHCETVPWRTIDEFNDNRSLFEEWRRSQVLKTLDDWRDWESYLAGTNASRKGVRRGEDGVIGQAKRIVMKAYALRQWGFKGGGTYKDFADHLTAAGYPTTVMDIKNAKRAKFDLVENSIPHDALEIFNLIGEILKFEYEFEWWKLVGEEMRELDRAPHVEAA